MNFRILIILIGLFVANDTVLAQVVLRESGDVPDQYIVSFESAIDIPARIKQEKSKVFELLRQIQQENITRLKADLADTDLVVVANLWFRQSIAVRISAEYLGRLVEQTYIKSIQADKQYQLQPLGVQTLPMSGEKVTDNLERIMFDSVWNDGYRGQGIVVAVIDSGIDIEHKTLKSRWRGGSNSWFDPFTNSATPSDFSGHGTAVASILLGGNEAVGTIGVDNYTGAYIGVAPNAQWIAAKIFNSTNGSTASSSVSVILQALQWVLDPDGNAATDDYPDVVQNSWGIAASEGKCTNTDFNAALDALDALGIDIVFAVGNSGGGPGTFLAPSFHPAVISVGAVNSLNPLSETILLSSSRGPNTCNLNTLPSLVAPGVDIVAAVKSLGSVSATRKVGKFTGTSFSAPHVAGALVLLRSYFDSPGDYRVFRNALFSTAKDLGATGNDPDYGRGLIKVDLAATNLLNNTAVNLKAAAIRFSNANYVFSEKSAIVEVSLIRQGDISAAAAVDIVSESVTATSGVDFLAVVSRIDFNPGESSKTLQISLLDDSLAENNEYFNLVIVGTSTKLRVTITDDDSVVEADKIGGSSSGLIELLIFGLLLLGRHFRR